MTERGTESQVKFKYQDLSLDLNLDKATADDAWNSYENIKISYVLEGDQLPWLACALYVSCRSRSVPTVGGRPGNMIQGNCVSLTRMLRYCKLPLPNFIRKMQSWLAMTQCDREFCDKINLLERNFAVSINIFKEYKPIYLDLFQDPSKDLPRPPRSRKQRRPPCNSTELYNFCWTLYIFIKAKYPGIPEDLVNCFSLLLACIDLMYINVIVSNRKDLINPNCKGLPEGLLENDNLADYSSMPVSIMDYLCKKYQIGVVDSKIVRDYYWKPNIKDLLDKNILKGTPEGTYLIDQNNFDHNIKEVQKAYEESQLSNGDFDERMFLENPALVKGSSQNSSPGSNPTSATGRLVLTSSPSIGRSAQINLTQTFADSDQVDRHLVQQTPITGRTYTINRPVMGDTPLTVVTTGLHKLYALIAGRKAAPGEHLIEILSDLSNNPEERIKELIAEMSTSFTSLYSQASEDYKSPSLEFTKMRLQTSQILYYTFLEHILSDEKKRGVDLEAILREDLFHRTLFTCCIEIVLKSYNDARRFPWSLGVSNVDPYYFMKIIEPVIRSEKQSENQLSRELVKHLKSIEEQILDSLSWRDNSPLWQKITEAGMGGVPSCEDVNFSHQLESSPKDLNQSLPSCSIVSPMLPNRQVSDSSPISSFPVGCSSPLGQNGARRMLFPSPHSQGEPGAGPTVLTLMKPPTLMGLKSVVTTNSPIQSSPRLTPEVTIASTSTRVLLTPSPVVPGESTSKSGGTKEKPRRHGSLALFFRKFYTLANLRFRDLLDRLDIRSVELRQKIWTCFEHSVIHYTDMMRDRHMDQNIMCSIYIICKVTGTDRSFQEIMKHYRNQPQAASHVYRSVLISSTASTAPSEAAVINTQAPGPPATPSQVRGTSITLLSGGERGDLITYYNRIYVTKIKLFALKFKPTTQGAELPRLSPLPVIRTTPVSPRKRISSNHSVFINPLNSSPINNLSSKPYVFNRSPAKDLRVINHSVKRTVPNRLNVDGGEPEAKRQRLDNLKMKMLGVFEERHTTCTENSDKKENISSSDLSNIQLDPPPEPQQ